jgi:lipopolysaccharide/colanic/teichoic acid biosynthesis glycosyltransferase
VHLFLLEELVRTSLGQAVGDDVVETFEYSLVNFESDYYAPSPEPSISLSNNPQYQYMKRAVDLLGSLILICIFVVPGLLIAAAIVLTSRGPVFYREERLGRGGRPFRIWKFRSMHRNAHWKKHVKSAQQGGVVLEWRMCKERRDPRITRVGGFLRRWSLDELPQLLNVLLGDMSLVGPRPIIQSETSLYRELLPYYLAAVPGLSGAWQVSGRSKVGYDDRAKLDAQYVSKWSMGTDIAILLRTVPAVLSRIGAY